jgi:biopolymer transport protein ExbD
MRFQRRHRQHSEVSAGALTDIMFFLMLFFLIVSTVTNPNVIKLVLPQASASKSVSKQNIAVSITKDIKYYIEKQEIPVENLKQEISERIKNLEAPTIVLRVEEGVPVEHLVKVLDIGIQLKVKVVLATRTK